MFTLRTDRLLLRDFTPEDFEPFYATTTDAEYRAFYPEHEMTREHWQEIFKRILPPTGTTLRTGYQLAVCLGDGALIGTCGVRIEDLTHQQASFGCAIAKDYWGGGYAYEASKHLFDFGFASLPIHRIYAETNCENPRSRALAERLGMRLEGELRQTRYFNNRWWDTAIYAVLKDEWV
jgi:[ribosomal protein S5]-alanine N-acetyltransferase